jgi:multidrug efflux pump subunit AcrA (membrane-fusion protein)
MSWLRYSAIAAVAIFVVGGSGYWFLGRDKVAANDASAEKGSGVKAEVVHAKAGGIPRTTVQPGSVEPFSGASLYDRVKKGELLAEIEIPELEAQADRNEAKVDDAQAKLKQVIAQRSEAEAEARAAESSVKLAAILVKAKTAFREYREKQLNRIKELVAKKAEDQRLQDEQEDYYLSAMEAENAAKEKVNAEKERETAAKVKILRVEADIKAAEADVAVAKAEWANSKVWVQYGKIAAPCDGVVTQRGYLQWDFIKAADLGGNTPPILTIISTDVLRVVVPVPDRDVPFVTPGKQPFLRSMPCRAPLTRLRVRTRSSCRASQMPRITRRVSCASRWMCATRMVGSSRGCTAGPHSF